ncbi:MAG: hypothetical protein OXH20_05595 [bacterium]|nr:hypothetical protein [bacterium]MDE0668346.1 hypothetical protein [bacterium]MXZ30543.1 hypothetical protein [Acidimicrobiia bacterium]MYB23596.1 hypothetical protein [Acidimicrobiia bacterium]
MATASTSIKAARPSFGRGLLRRAAQSGQATAEYALVLLGVAFIAVLVLDWARNTNMISRLLNAVFRSISKLIT